MPCPKCGSFKGQGVVEGKDFLYGIPGRYSVWECASCGLQFLNPQPPSDRLSELYPSTYSPHGGVSTINGNQFQALTLRDRLKRFRPIAAIWPSLHASRSGLRATKSRVKRWLTDSATLHPVKAGFKDYICEQMGYTHLRQSTRRQGLLRRISRSSCRRQACIELIPHFVSGGHLLEIGCATGDRLQRLRELGWKNLDGIELVPRAAERAKEQGFRILCEPVETGITKYPDSYFDVVVSSMVLEHLPNPFTVVREIARKVKPGGEFLFSTVTRDSLDARLFGPYWSGYDFPRHMVYFRKRDIRDMVAKDFFELEWIHQNAPIDFVRPATWRWPEGRLTDRIILLLARSPLANVFGGILAGAGQTCRISFRCRRKLFTA